MGISLLDMPVGVALSQLLGGGAPPAGNAAPPGGVPPVANPIPSNAPTPADGPSAAPMPAQLPPQSLIDQLGTPAHRSVTDRLRDIVTGGDPAGYDGLLTPQEIASTRPSLLSSILHGEGTASGIQREKLDHIVALKQAAVFVQRQRQIQADRDTFMQQNPPPTSGTAQDMAAWVSKALPYAYAHGDFESVKELAPLADQILHPAAAARPPAGDPYISDSTHEIRYFDKAAGSSVPPGWSKMKSGSAGQPVIFTGTKNGRPDYVPVSLDDPQQMASLVAQGYKPDIDERTQFVQGNTNARFDKTYVRQSVNDFNNEIKPLTTKATSINAAENVLTQALSDKNPDVRAALSGPVVSQFVQSVEQSQNLRFQLLNYYTAHIDNSFKGTWEILKQRILTGTLPGNKLQAMQSIVGEAKRLVQQEIQARRDNRLKADPRLDGVLPDANSYFQTVANPASASDVEAWIMANPPKNP